MAYTTHKELIINKLDHVTWADPKMEQAFYNYCNLYQGRHVLSRFGYPGLLGHAKPESIADKAFCFIELNDICEIIPTEEYTRWDLLRLGWVRIYDK